MKATYFLSIAGMAVAQMSGAPSASSGSAAAPPTPSGSAVPAPSGSAMPAAVSGAPLPSGVMPGGMGMGMGLGGINFSQIESQAMSVIANLSTSCKLGFVQLATNSSLASCLQVSSLPKLFNSTSQVLPPAFDAYLSQLCYSQPCSNATLTMAASMLESACATDLAKYNITNTTVNAVFNAYPLAREVACLKTSSPFNSSNVTVPATSSIYNQTNGTFCVTSLMTEVEAYLGANLTANYLLGLVNGTNMTTLNATKNIPITAICNDCIFGAIDIIERSYPKLANLSYGPMGLSFNGTSGININAVLNGTCAAKNLSISTNGTLPSTISVSAINSTYPYNLTNGMTTFSMGKRAFVALFDPTVMKKRWLGDA